MSGLVIHVRTRSKVLDYRFIGTMPPPERWWEEFYGRWTDFSRPTILVEPGKFFVSGVSSKHRTDSKGARVHYALHVKVESEGRTLAAQVLAWLCEVRQRTGSLEEVGERLDKLGEDAWSAAVRGERGAVEEIVANVTDMLQKSPYRPESNVALQSFLLDADQAQAFARLATAAAAVVALEPRRPERAVYLNLASASELTPLLKHGRSAVVCREIDARPKFSRPLLAGVTVAMLGLILVTTCF